MEINKENYKEWLVRYLEDDLTNIEKFEADAFIKGNEWAAQEWDLLKRTRLKPNIEIRFPDKRLLFRVEEPTVELKKRAVVFKLYHYMTLAAAAALLAFAIIFSIHKPETKIETAHSNIHNTLTPNVKQPKNPQALSVPQLEANSMISNKLSDNAHNIVHRSLIASQKPAQQPLQKIGIKAPVTGPERDINYATNKIPVTKPADSQTIKPAIKEIQEPVNQVAVAKKPPASIPVKVDANSYGNDKSLLQSLLGLLHKISIKKEVVNDQTYYAVSIETPDIKINKTIK